MPSVQITTQRLRDKCCGTVYRASITGKCNGCKFTGWTLTGHLPPGIEFDEDTGKLMGIPTTVGKYEFDVTLNAQDKQGNELTTTKTLEIIIYSPSVGGSGSSSGGGGSGTGDDNLATDEEAGEALDDIFGPGSGGGTSGGTDDDDDPFNNIFP